MRIMFKLFAISMILFGGTYFVIKKIQEKWKAFLHVLFNVESDKKVVTGKLQSCKRCAKQVAQELVVKDNQMFFCSEECAHKYRNQV